jgi:hypothetical protein
MPKSSKSERYLTNRRLLIGLFFPVTVLFLLIIILLIKLPYFTKEYCLANPLQCVGKGINYEIPSNVFSSILGSITGASFSFVAFIIIDLIRNYREDKNQKISQDREDASEAQRREIEKNRENRFKPNIKSYFMDSDNIDAQKQFIDEYSNHKIQTKTKKSYDIGKTFWARIKIVNEGNIVANQCRAYLTKVSKADVLFSSNKNIINWNNISEFSNSMPLLWAYEKQSDYFIVGSGINLPSNASYFADIIVIYNPALNILENNECIYLKIKTKPHPPQHFHICKIDRKANISYKFDIEVYANECDTSKLSFVVEHQRQSSELLFYCLDESGQKQVNVNQKSIDLPENQQIKVFSKECENGSYLNITNEEKEEIYDEL